MIRKKYVKFWSVVNVLKLDDKYSYLVTASHLWDYESLAHLNRLFYRRCDQLHTDNNHFVNYHLSVEVGR